MDKNRRDTIVAEIDALIAGHTGRDRTVSPGAMRVAPDGAADLDVAPDSITEVFGEPMAVYTRADAIRDGSQIEVPAGVCREVGIGVPTALTSAVWEDCVAWTDTDAERTGAIQDQDGRLFDVVYMAWRAVHRARPVDSTPVPFVVCRVARDTLPGVDGAEPTEVRLWIVLGADYDGSPCVTITTREDL